MIPIKVFQKYSDMPLPQYQSHGAAAMDLCAAMDFMCHVNEVVKVPTGLHVEIPPGWEIEIYSRSGLAADGFFVANQPGTIDCDYRGEIMVLLLNIGSSMRSPYFKKGERIAQIKLKPVYKIGWNVVARFEDLSDTKRGNGGFGSTGT